MVDPVTGAISGAEFTALQQQVAGMLAELARMKAATLTATSRDPALTTLIAWAKKTGIGQTDLSGVR